MLFSIKQEAESNLDIQRNRITSQSFDKDLQAADGAAASASNGDNGKSDVRSSVFVGAVDSSTASVDTNFAYPQTLWIRKPLPVDKKTPVRADAGFPRVLRGF